MKHSYHHDLSVARVADHFVLTPATVRARRKAGDISAVRVGGEWRFSWPDVWAAEQGPAPRGDRADAYKEPLLTKKGLGAQWGVSERTVERWIEAGLPTRNVFGSVRIAAIDANDWVRQAFTIEDQAAGANAGSKFPILRVWRSAKHVIGASVFRWPSAAFWQR